MRAAPPLRSAFLAALPAALLAVVLIPAGPAAADTSAVLKCAEIAEPQARLACYDRTVPALRRAAPAPAPAAKAGPDSFGAERLPAARAATAAEGPEEMTAKVVAVRKRDQQLPTYTLDNGQIWRQTEDLPLPIRVGTAVVLRRGALGSYSIAAVGSGRVSKAVRLQ